MHTRIRFQGLRRRSLLVVVVLALLLSLLPTAAFAAAGGHRGPHPCRGGPDIATPNRLGTVGCCGGGWVRIPILRAHRCRSIGRMAAAGWDK